MKQIGFLLLVMMISKEALLQELPSFKTLRYEEDYSWLRNDTATNLYRKIKFIPLSKQSKNWLSIGGESRVQYFYAKNENWGDALQDDNGYLLARLLAHADIRLGKDFRTFVQLQSSVSADRINPSAVDENYLDLHQAFVEYNIEWLENAFFTLRAGRQEFSYGSQRLISVREGPNNRQSFDAARLILKDRSYKVDLFYAHYVLAKKKLFDDGFNPGTKLWGTYLVINSIPLVRNIDLYYLGLWKKNALFDDAAGEELRHSFGCRLWSNDRDWQYDVESLFQTGSVNNKKIRAWTASINSSYIFRSVLFKPTFGLKAELISGDKNYDDRTVQTFNPLFPRGAYFGLAALIGPANLVDLHPSIDLHLLPQLSVGIDYDHFWRYSRNDGLYGVNAVLIYTGRNSAAKKIGGQYSFNIAWQINPFVQTQLESTFFKAGEFLKQAGEGKNILFTGLTVQAKW